MDAPARPEAREEAAYRRGCHQAIAMAADFIRDEKPDDPVEFLLVLSRIVKRLRSTPGSVPYFMHLAIQKAKTEYQGRKV